MQNYTTRRCKCGAYTDYGILCTKCTQTEMTDESVDEEEATVAYTIALDLSIDEN